MYNSFYAYEELKDFGFRCFGSNVLISRKVSIYSSEEISIGNNVRIDDFCILSGKIEINDYVHIACYTAMFGGKAGISIGSYSTLSSKVNVYAKTDDYSGEFMTNPMISEKYTNVIEKPVIISECVIIGSGCIILPGANIQEGVACGAFTLVNKDLEAWNIYTGIPARILKSRSKRLLDLKKEFLAD